MARPLVFISSTVVDLKYVRAALAPFIESLGYNVVLSERGDVPFAHDDELDRSCYNEVSNCDIFVLIIGSRYGSRSSIQPPAQNESETDKSSILYESVTKTEYKYARNLGKPIYIAIESQVDAEFYTYRKNKKNIIEYAHADPNVYRFIEEVKGQSRNNAYTTFERTSDIAEWLREQWAGRFRELLSQKTDQQQLTSLNAQVQTLTVVNETLQRYLEKIVTIVDQANSKKLIDEEQERLRNAKLMTQLNKITTVGSLGADYGVPIEVTVDALQNAPDRQDFFNIIFEYFEKDEAESDIFEASERARDIVSYLEVLFEDHDRQKEINAARKLVGMPPLYDDARPVRLE